ncbi:MAG: hypothetical protein EA377_12070 [Phycisphaerales bacterium]|nr:MAG: hypothetical protein EA377_12070 [Phycisphaerales bacterium]
MTAGWGVFCACSWTWCIGMFLPIIMLERYGWPGFLIFAVPNVLGCAAFGYVLRNRDRSRRLIERHRLMMRWFSIVTLAYHAFFVSLIAILLAPFDIMQNTQIALVLPAVFFAFGLLISHLSDRIWPLLAIAVYALSLTAFSQIGGEAIKGVSWSGEYAESEWLWLLPTVAFGFLLCPYLDLTFHRALQRSPSRHAFGVFGGTFAIMIIFTIAYRDLFDIGLTGWILAHLAAQTLFTISAHLRELRRDDLAMKPAIDHVLSAGRTPWWPLLLPLLAGPIALLVHLGQEPIQIGKELYLRFLVAYGLIFPAYVLLAMAFRRIDPNRMKHWILFGLVMLLLSPMYEFGFIQGTAQLLPISLLLLMVLAVFGRLWLTPEVDRR